MSTRELRALQGARGTSPPRGRKRLQSNAQATNNKRPRTTNSEEEEEGGNEAKAEPQPVKKAAVKGKRVAKPKKAK
jgi:hypothetical protein